MIEWEITPRGLMKRIMLRSVKGELKTGWGLLSQPDWEVSSVGSPPFNSDPLIEGRSEIAVPVLIGVTNTVLPDG